MQDLTKYLNPAVGLHTVQDIKDLIHFKTGVARIRPVVRLLHDDLTPFYLPVPVDENDPTNISKFVETAKVTCNSKQDVNRDCDLVMREIPGIGQLNTLKTLIQIFVQFVGPAPERTVLLDVPIGIFNLAIPDRKLYDGAQVWEVKGYDLTWRMKDLWFLDSYVIPAGTLITDAIKILLMMDELPPSQGGRYPATPVNSTSVPVTSGGSTPANLYCNAGALVQDPTSGCYLLNGVYVHTRHLLGLDTPGGTTANGAPYPAMHEEVFYSAGVLVDPSSGCPIDPNTCTPTTYKQTTCPNPYGPGVVTLGSFLMANGDTMSGDGRVTSNYDPCNVGFGGTTYQVGSSAPLPIDSSGLDASGGDPTGGYDTVSLSSNDTKATAQFVPVWSGWPDPNNAALTPSGCETVGPNIPASRIDIAPSTITADMPIFLTRRMNVLQSINQMLTAINYYPLWVDEVGVFHSSPIPYETAVIPSAEWAYVTDDTSIIKAEVTQKIADQTALANVVSVVCENNKKKPITSVQYNMNLNSAISVPNVGYAIVKLIKDDKIPSQETADLRAYVELNLAALASEAVEWTTHLNPFHQVHDFVELNVFNRQGVLEIDSSTYPFEETAWEMDLITQEMKHTGGRIVPL